ncbi:MAG: helix-turn-helix domain-containing protein [Symbiobacteriaceae bacterium]|nr:helix-turn-helix domain-containing protein [Symbiobacteriaceae bacterium]
MPRETSYENINLGKVLREARKNSRLSQETVAEKCGMSTRYVSAIESGKKNPTFSYVYHFVRLTNADPVAIFHPENQTINDTREQIDRMLKRCSDDTVDITLTILKALMTKESDLL